MGLHLNCRPIIFLQRSCVFSKGYNETVTIDKALYRKAFEQYRQWNEAELRERFRNAGKHTPQERWKVYLSLWNFCQKLGVKPSEYQRQQKLKSLELYYERLQKMEAWRSAKGIEPLKRT